MCTGNWKHTCFLFWPYIKILMTRKQYDNGKSTENESTAKFESTVTKQTNKQKQNKTKQKQKNNIIL